MRLRQTPIVFAVFSASVAAFSTTTLAQEDQGALLEEIVVTGSYLYTGIDSPSPVSAISGEDMVAFAPPDQPLAGRHFFGIWGGRDTGTVYLTIYLDSSTGFVS